MKKTINDLRNMKGESPVTWITSYNYWQAKSAESAGVDLILCGDSYGNVECGHKSTIPVSLDEMLRVTENVRRGAPNTFVVGDFPMGSYEVSNEQAISTAVKFIKSGADSVKLEGSSELIMDRISAISEAGILCCSHGGVQPQSSINLKGGYRCEGKTIDSFNSLITDTERMEEAGASFILIEGVVGPAAKQIANGLEVPVYGIGAGPDVDGQLMIFHDLCGLFPDFRPFFAKNYVPQVLDSFNEKILAARNSDVSMKKFGRDTRADGMLELSQLAISKYVEEVREGSFPNEEYTYPIKPEELKMIQSSILWNSGEESSEE